jgi:hypothetical protein
VRRDGESKGIRSLLLYGCILDVRSSYRFRILYSHMYLVFFHGGCRMARLVATRIGVLNLMSSPDGEVGLSY